MAKKINKNLFSLGWGTVLAVVILIVAAGLVGHYSGRYAENHFAKTDQEVAGTQTFSYDGQDGKTALDLLKEKAQIQTEDSSVGSFVLSINNISDSEDHFWMFYVNGELAPVAADQYQSKTGDKIEWRYEQIQ